MRRFSLLALSFLLITVFVLMPLGVILKMSLSVPGEGSGEFLPWINWQPIGKLLQLQGNSFTILLSDSLYLEAFLNSTYLALLTTLCCLVMGVPFAYFLSRCSAKVRNGLLLMVLLPFWTSFLLRIYAWKSLLSAEGWLSELLTVLSLVDEPSGWLYSTKAVLIGMVYVYLPFMILPIYAFLVKFDQRLWLAASNLGANPWQSFVWVTLPLAKNSIIIGCVFVFIPTLGEYVIPSLLGSADTLTIGRVLWDEFFTNNDWSVASAIAVFFGLFIFIGLFWLPQDGGKVR